MHENFFLCREAFVVCSRMVPVSATAIQPDDFKAHFKRAEALHTQVVHACVKGTGIAWGDSGQLACFVLATIPRDRAHALH